MAYPPYWSSCKAIDLKALLERVEKIGDRLLTRPRPLSSTGEIGDVNTDATSTRLNDATETAAVKRVWSTRHACGVTPSPPSQEREILAVAG
jgi:hypothetical protein